MGGKEKRRVKQDYIKKEMFETGLRVFHVAKRANSMGRHTKMSKRIEGAPPPLALRVQGSQRRSAPRVLAPTGWRRCPPRARPPRARGRRRLGRRRKGRERGALPALACSRTARVTGWCVREGPAPGGTDGRARAAARGVRVPVGGPGRREVRVGRRAAGVPGGRGRSRSRSRSRSRRSLLRGCSSSARRRAAVSPRPAHTRPASPPAAAAPPRHRQPQRRSGAGGGGGGGGGGTRGAALCAARRGAAAQPPDRGPGARCTFRPHEEEEVKAAAARLPPSVGGGRGRKGRPEGGARDRGPAGLPEVPVRPRQRWTAPSGRGREQPPGSLSRS
ncbi:5E5 antigen-like [Canis lupus familiaris]|uniref:5E5 antigen-like n=1 Tax=Canis lupus familiaris TaxID=9615 RepID=UPI0018F7DB78|nr:5E5 antigen-like [Canis lupus familiaris]